MLSSQEDWERHTKTEKERSYNYVKHGTLDNEQN